MFIISPCFCASGRVCIALWHFLGIFPKCLPRILLPSGSNVFSFTVDLLSEGRQTSLTELPPLKVGSFQTFHTYLTIFNSALNLQNCKWLPSFGNHLTDFNMKINQILEESLCHNMRKSPLNILNFFPLYDRKIRNSVCLNSSSEHGYIPWVTRKCRNCYHWPRFGICFTLLLPSWLSIHFKIHFTRKQLGLNFIEVVAEYCNI